MDYSLTHRESISPSGGEQLAVEQSKSPYDRAREHIEGFRSWLTKGNTATVLSEAYQEDFSVKLPQKEWIRLYDDLKEYKEDERLKYPKFSYYASTSTLIIHTTPSPVHEFAVKIIERGFIGAVPLFLPGSNGYIISTSTNEKYFGFWGKYKGSVKIPDVGVTFQGSDGNRELKLVVEAGFSQGYDRLVQDAKLWLEGSHEVSTVILIYIEESPSYQSPLHNLEDEEIGQLELSWQPKIDFSTEGDFGPVTCKGLTWVGRITRASMEVWRRDPSSGLSTRNGDRIDFLPPAGLPQLEFKLSDFTTVSQDDFPIRFEWFKLRTELKVSIMKLATERYAGVIEDLEKREGARDRDYEEPAGGEEPLD